MSTNKLFNNKTNSDNFLKDFLKSNESKIDKVRQENVMINCECNIRIFKDFEVKVKQDLNFLRFFNIKIKDVIKEESLLVEQKT